MRGPGCRGARGESCSRREHLSSAQRVRTCLSISHHQRMAGPLRSRGDHQLHIQLMKRESWREHKGGRRERADLFEAPLFPPGKNSCKVGVTAGVHLMQSVIHSISKFQSGQCRCQVFVFWVVVVSLLVTRVVTRMYLSNSLNLGTPESTLVY